MEGDSAQRGGSRNCRKSLDACRIYRACAHGLENGGTVFYSKPFAEICKKEGEKTWLLYRGLSAGYYNSSNVETFLEENGCKQALTFTAAKPEIQVKDVQETVREELQILKNGWGPVSLKVQTEDDFLFLEKNRIGEDDF